jgi:predicted PurR-regulated permease PerM
MNYSETIVLIVSFLTLLISLFAIWLAIMFYRYYSQLSLLVNEMSRGLDITTTRLEKISDLLYGEKNSIPDKQEDNAKADINLLKKGEETV